MKVGRYRLLLGAKLLLEAGLAAWDTDVVLGS